MLGKDEITLRGRQEQDVAGLGAAYEGPGDGAMSVTVIAGSCPAGALSE